MPRELNPKKWRPVYVRYVAVRFIRNNPSWANSRNDHDIDDLWAGWEKRHPRRERPDMTVSLPPAPTRKKKTK